MITGGTRGIGLGIARALAQEGYDLALNGVREEKSVSEVLEELRTTGVDTVYCRGDIASSQGREQVVEKVKKHFGHLHVLVNNAGIAPPKRKDVLEVDEETYRRVMETNLTGPFFLTQQVAAWMIEQKKKVPDYEGCIINISSVSAEMVTVSRSEYCISKAGLSMSTKLFAVRLGEYGIPVYELRPGITETDMTAPVKEKYDQMIAEGLQVQNRWGTPEDNGKAVAALVRGDFPFSTGQIIYVDGGLAIPRL